MIPCKLLIGNLQKSTFNKLNFYTFTNYKMQFYLDTLKKCKTLHWAAQVYIAVLLDEKLTNKEKNAFQDVYVEYTQNLN